MGRAPDNLGMSVDMDTEKTVRRGTKSTPTFGGSEEPRRPTPMRHRFLGRNNKHIHRSRRIWARYQTQYRAVQIHIHSSPKGVREER